MNRGSFLRQIVMIVVAPDIITQLQVKPPGVPNTRNLLQNMNFIVPDYMPKLIEKYGNINWTDEYELLKKDKTENPKLYECFKDGNGN